MTVLYPNLCYNEVYYKGTALYPLLQIKSVIHWFQLIEHIYL